MSATPQEETTHARVFTRSQVEAAIDHAVACLAGCEKEDEIAALALEMLDSSPEPDYRDIRSPGLNRAAASGWELTGAT